MLCSITLSKFINLNVITNNIIACDELLIEEIPEDLFVSSTNFLQSNQLIQQISHFLIELLK